MAAFDVPFLQNDKIVLGNFFKKNLYILNTL